jgi:hypothetical protein
LFSTEISKKKSEKQKKHTKMNEHMKDGHFFIADRISKFLIMGELDPVNLKRMFAFSNGKHNIKI